MKKFIILFITLLAMLFNSACAFNLNYFNLNHYEDKLYSEKSLYNYTTIAKLSNPNAFTRDKAIEKSLTLFNTSFGANIDKSKISEFVNLIKNADSSFEWFIRWYEPYSKELYECRIDTDNGNVLYMSHTYNVQSTNEPFVGTAEEVEKLALPLIKALDIDLNQYDLINLKREAEKTFYNPIVSLVYLNKTNSNNRIIIDVDFKRKEIVSYIYLYH